MESFHREVKAIIGAYEQLRFWNEMSDNHMGVMSGCLHTVGQKRHVES